MKILVVYFSQTGNTEMIARAVHDRAATNHEVDLCKMEDIGPGRLSEYDLVFVGSPIHRGGIAGDVQKFMAALPESLSFAVASLVTHASSLFRNEAFEKGIKEIEDICREKSIEYLGCFHCQGKLDPKIQPIVKKIQNVPDDEWQRRMDQADQHPSDEDLANARSFADQVISQLSAKSI